MAPRSGAAAGVRPRDHHGVVLAVVIGERRWVARGGTRGVVTDLATVAVPFGIVGARVYHVVTSPQAYLDDPISALYVWQGGLGIPGGILGGFLAGWVVARRRGIAKGAFADAIAPGVAVAQAVGRLGNWFNQELFGRPTTLPWGLEIDADNPDAVVGAQAYHPTFLYELLWNLGVAERVVLWADRRFRLGGGRAFALYLGALRGRALLDRGACASTTPTASPACGSTSTSWGVVLGRRGDLPGRPARRRPRGGRRRATAAEPDCPSPV